MKLQPNFSALLTALFFITTIILGITSCNQHPKMEANKDIAEVQNESRFPDTCEANDAQFLVNAAYMNYHQIALGQLAKAKTQTPEILVFAQMMIDEHTKSMTDIKLIADKKNVTLPPSAENDTEGDNNQLLKISGRKFDKAYSDLMVGDHKEAIVKFENVIEEGMDNDIRNWASITLPILKLHLGKAIECQKKNG